MRYQLGRTDPDVVAWARDQYGRLVDFVVFAYPGLPRSAAERLITRSET